MNNFAIEQQEAPKDIESTLLMLDEELRDESGIKPSEAWRYREEVKAKYGLPECVYMWNDPERFIREAEEYAKQNDIDVRPKHEFEGFFNIEEHKGAEAAAFSESVFRNSTVTVEESGHHNLYGLRKKAKQLAHELVHAIQSKKYPRMPDEEEEKEAFYYQLLTPNFFIRNRDKPDFVHHYLNDVIPRWIESSCEITESANKDE